MSESNSNYNESAEVGVKSKKSGEKKSFIIKYGGLIFIVAVIVAFIILAVTGVNFGQILANTVFDFYREGGDFGIYLGIFLISIFGNFTIIFPVPYVIAIIVISAVVPSVNPIILGIVAGLGASIGEVSAWLIGRGSKEFAKDSEQMNRMAKYVEKGWAPLLIFIFAATPLPDDAFLVVLGFAQYSLMKTLIWCFFGKFVLCTLMSAIPVWIYGINEPLGDFFLGLFGINLETAQTGIIQPSTPDELITSTVMWIGTILIMFLLIYIDWGKVFKRNKKDKNHPDVILRNKDEDGL